MKDKIIVTAQKMDRATAEKIINSLEKYDCRKCINEYTDICMSCDSAELFFAQKLDIKPNKFETKLN